MKKQNMKKGITLIEIILAIVLIAIIMGITIPKLMSNSTKAEIKQTVTSDIRSIVEAATTWKRASSQSAGTYRDITSGKIDSRLPSNMTVDGTKGIIYSSGLKTGTQDGTFNETGVRYTIMWQFDSALTDTGRFSMAMDVKKGMDELDWNGKITQYAKDVYNDTIFEITDGDLSTYTAANIKALSTNEGATQGSTGGAGEEFTCTSTGTSVCTGNMRVN